MRARCRKPPPFPGTVLEVQATRKLRHQPARVHRRSGIFSEQALHSTLQPGNNRGPKTKIAGSLPNQAAPFLIPYQIARKRPHLKVHQIVRAFAGKYDAAIGGDGAKLVKQASKEWIANRFGRPYFWGV